MNDETPDEKLSKLAIDDSSNLRFHAAYLVYSKAWAENLDKEARSELNTIMQSLSQNKDYSTFYQKINQYRKDVSDRYSDRRSFTSQRKRAWRKSEAKKMRLSRHKK